MSTAIVQHSSATNEHGTPAGIVESARQWMGGIDLDPASCEEAQRTVGATEYFSPEKGDDGLRLPWHGRVLLNPPGGKLRLVDGVWVSGVKGAGESSQLVWWEKLMAEIQACRVEKAVFVAFNLEILRTSQRRYPVQHCKLCFPRERLKFTALGRDASNASPSHANVIVGVGGYLDTFSDAFSCHGLVC